MRIATERQVRFLAQRGVNAAGWPFLLASSLIDAIAVNGWKLKGAYSDLVYGRMRFGGAQEEGAGGVKTE